MNTQVTLTGLVATTPRQTNGQTRFRLVTVEGEGNDHLASDGSSHSTNWFTIKCPVSMADNVLQSIQKGNRVILTGDLQVNEWDNGEMTGTTVEIVVSAIGYDLTYGVSENTRIFKTEDN